MRLQRPAALAVLTALVPVLASCGGGGTNTAEPLPRPPTLTVPGKKAAPAITKDAATETGASGDTTSTGTSTATAPATATPAPTTTQSNPVTPAGGAAPPQNGGASPDSPQHDQPPPDGSPAQRFEQFCKDNPGAC